jgi:hypothetical protein
MLMPGRALRSKIDQQPAPPAGDEHTGCHDDPQPVELRPAEHLLERAAPDPLPDHAAYVAGGRGLRVDQRGLVLCEHAAGGAQR